jgi:hypothetical protein
MARRRPRRGREAILAVGLFAPYSARIRSFRVHFAMRHAGLLRHKRQDDAGLTWG